MIKISSDTWQRASNSKSQEKNCHCVGPGKFITEIVCTIYEFIEYTVLMANGEFLV